MAGRWIHTPEPPHRCEPPTRLFGDSEGPDGRPGWVWECDCGQQWKIVASALPMVRSGLFGPGWRRRVAEIDRSVTEEGLR